MTDNAVPADCQGPEYLKNVRLNVILKSYLWKGDLAMAEDIKNVNIEEEEEDIITLEFDDDTAVDCYVMGTFELNGKEYIALEPEDGTGDVYIYGYKQVSDDEFEILEIESEEEFDAAAAEFDAIMSEEEDI